jgi:hypothetical protein
MAMNKEVGRVPSGQALAVPAEPVSRLGPLGFDPSRMALGLYRVQWVSGGTSLASIYMDASGGRWIAPTNWIAPGPLPGNLWSAIEKFEPIEVLENAAEALEFACNALREVGDDYPGSSCHKWCHEKADEAEAIAAGDGL